MVQSKEKDPNVLYKQFRKRGAIEFRGTEDVLKADEWLEHIEDVFGTVICTQKQKVSLISSMLREVAKTWRKSVSEATSKLSEAMIWETFKQQFQRKFVPEHVRQKKESEFLHLKQGQLIVAAYVHTILQLSKYATDLVDTEDRKVKRFLNGLNPTYKKMLLANKPTTINDVVDRAYMAEEVQREEIAENESAKRSSSEKSTGSWFKRGGQLKGKNKKQKFTARTENKPVCETCGKAHKTELCWRTTGACLVCGSLEHKMVQCPRVSRDDRALYQWPAQRQAALPAPPQ